MASTPAAFRPRREMVRLGLWLLLLGSVSLGAPHSRYCGGQLADVIALVCQDRGYNMPLTPQIHGEETTYERRFKRGIVDECCKRGCSKTTLESYCSPSTTQRPDNLQIRKRSEHSGKKQIEETEEWTEPRVHGTDKFSYKVNELGGNLDKEEKSEEVIRHQKRRSFEHSTPDRRSGHHNRIFYMSSERRHHGPSYRHSNRPREKVKRKSGEAFQEDGGEYADIGFHPGSRFNDALSPEDFMAEVVWSSDQLDFLTTPHVPPFRHHRERKYNRFDPRNMKRKGTENEGDSGTTSQIGTVSPYFLGRTLVLPSSSRKGFLPHT